MLSVVVFVEASLVDGVEAGSADALSVAPVTAVEADVRGVEDTEPPTDVATTVSPSPAVTVPEVPWNVVSLVVELVASAPVGVDCDDAAEDVVDGSVLEEASVVCVFGAAVLVVVAEATFEDAETVLAPPCV